MLTFYDIIFCHYAKPPNHFTHDHVGETTFTSRLSIVQKSQPICSATARYCESPPQLHSEKVLVQQFEAVLLL